MALVETWAVARRASFGTLRYKQLYNTTFAYTETLKKVAAGTSTAILAATNGAASAQNVTSVTQPDVPRALSVTPTANTTGSPLSVVITGLNVEGKTFTESFIIPANSTTIVNGVKAFKSITNVAIPGNSSGLTITVGTRNLLGVYHRLFNQNTTVKVFAGTAVGNAALTLQAQPTVVASEAEIERNTVSPATTPDGNSFYVICYTYDNWSDGTSINDQPEYSTTTSTSSTSSSTSTTTITTSTSSTSVSTSSTSSSSTSSSISTSSTSTSTTTAP